MTNVDFGRYKRLVQFFWDPEPKNNDNPQTPVWCLGEQYHCTPTSLTQRHSEESTLPDKSAQNGTDSFSLVEVITPDTSLSSSSEDGLAYGDAKRSAEDRGWPTSFLDDFESRIWLTYRSNFPPIPKSRDPSASSAMTLSVRLRSQLLEQGGFTSDAGWGCMIRSGQSLLANALVMLRLGRSKCPIRSDMQHGWLMAALEWRRGSRRNDEGALLSLFADDPGAAFSIHRFVEHGASACGKHPGEWFGPSATARCIQ